MTEFKHYLVTLFVLTLLLFAGAWMITAHLRQGFMPADFGVYQAKLDMIDRCELGDVAIMGDSRAVTGLIPGQFHARVTNLALIGMGPIEADYEFHRMLHCATLPKTVILTFTPNKFYNTLYFWSHGARYGVLDYAELEEIRKNEQALSPGLLYQSSYGSEPPGQLKNWFYAHHFPPYDFGSLVSGGVVGRFQFNADIYRQTMTLRGYLPYKGGNPDHHACVSRPDESLKPSFAADPLIDFYFRRLLAELQGHGIRILIAEPPVSEVTESVMTPGFKARFRDYLTQRSAGQYAVPDLDELFPVRPNCDFADDQHLTPQGAAAFSETVDRRLNAFTGQ